MSRYSNANPEDLYTLCDMVYDSYTVTRDGKVYELVGFIDGVPYHIVGNSIPDVLSAALRMAGH